MQLEKSTCFCSILPKGLNSWLVTQSSEAICKSPTTPWVQILCYTCFLTKYNELTIQASVLWYAETVNPVCVDFLMLSLLHFSFSNTESLENSMNCNGRNKRSKICLIAALMH